MLARTIAAIPASAISSIFDQATALKEGGRDLVDFSIGEPDFDTPAHICEAGAQAIADGITRYTSTDGTAALKDAIARKFLRDNGLKFSRAEIVVGAGAKPLLATAVQAVINPGEEAILTSPAWASHLGMLQLAGARPVLLETNLEGKFKLTASALEAAITPATRLLILCSPSNPTGAVYSAEQLQALAEVLRRHPQVLVISDDLYEHIVFDGHEFATLTAVAPDLSTALAMLLAGGADNIEEVGFPLQMQLSKNQFTSYLARCERAGISRLERTKLPLEEIGLDIEALRSATGAS